MKALLLDTINDKHFVGDTYADMAAATGRVSYDVAARTCTIQHSSHPHLFVNPTSTTLRYGKDWAVEDMLRDMAKEAVSFLCRNCGFVMYRSDL